jgi:hypothetical protein
LTERIGESDDPQPGKTKKGRVAAPAKQQACRNKPHSGIYRQGKVVMRPSIFMRGDNGLAIDNDMLYGWNLQLPSLSIQGIHENTFKYFG